MRLSEFPDAAEAAADKVKDTRDLMQRLAYIVIGPVKRHAKVRTGAMRNSIHDIVQPNKAVVGTNIIYAPYVNKRFPFMDPGLIEAMPRVEAELKDFGMKVIASVKG